MPTVRAGQPQPHNGAAIQFCGVQKTFVGSDNLPILAVNNLSLDVVFGETLCLIGTSGSGKTTTLRMVNRLVEPTSGKVLVEGVDIQNVDIITLRRKIGYVIQRGGLFPHLTVSENIGLLCTLEGWESTDRDKQIEKLLDLVNLEAKSFADRYPAELSGGERQRVGVARALALDPPFLLMDEPFGALDPITRDQLHEEFLVIAKELHKTILLVTHDLAEAFKLGHRVALMDRGKLIQLGTEKDFCNQPKNDFVHNFLQSHMNRT